MIVSRVDEIRAGHLAPQVLVVGAGAVGIPLAVALARQGRRVTLIEMGAAGPLRPDYVDQNDGPSTGAPHDGIRDGRAKALGGTTTLWGGQLVPFREIDFSPPYEGAPEWPVTYNEIQPWIAEAYDFLNISTSALGCAQSLECTNSASIDLGETISLSTHLWLREPNFSTLFRDDLESLEHLTVLVGVTAREFEYTSDGQVLAVTCEAANEEPLRFTAEQIVLANGTMEISRLLIRSARNDSGCPFSDNQNIGRYFIDHLHGIVGHLEGADRKRLRRIFDTAHVRNQKYTFKLRASDHFLRSQRIPNCAATLNGSNSVRGLASDTASLLKRIFSGGSRTSLPAALGGVWSSARVLLPFAWRYLMTRRSYSFIGNRIYVGIELEQVPTASSYLFVDQPTASARDPVGVHWSFNGIELEAARVFLRGIQDRFEHLGLGRLVISPEIVSAQSVEDLKLHDANHHIGGARMAEGPADGVVDRDLKVFGTTNLYVAGAAAFPSGSFANPTLTAIAFGLRLAGRLSSLTAAR